MKMLYVASGHPMQNSCDALMWERLGIEWFSTAYYTTTDKPGDLPYIQMKSRDKYLDEFMQQKMWTHENDKADTLCGIKNNTWTGSIAPNQFQFTKSFLSRFDVIFFNHFIDNVKINEKALRGKNVIFKTYSMHPVKHERIIKQYRRILKMKVVRNSPKEHLRCHSSQFGGVDAVIRGSVVRDEHEVSGWNGDTEKVCTFTSYLFLDQPRANYYHQIHNEVGCCDYFGIGNNFISHEDKLRVLRDYRVNLVTGTPNSNNTYSFVEAWIMGQPIVCYGRDMWNSSTYEADELITNGVDGFIGTTPDECIDYCKLLLKDKELAKSISQNAREKAISIYGRDVLAEKWKKLFRDIT